MQRDYYAVLGIAATAGPREIRQAYRRLARQYSPDVNFWDATAETLFEEIAEAYRVLSDPQARAMYDRFDDAPHAPSHACSASAVLRGPARAALRARREPLDVQPCSGTPNHFGERQVDDGVDVVTAASLRQRFLDGARMPEAVVHLARGRIREDSERLRDLVEQLAGALVPEIDIGRVLPREALIRSAHLARRSRRRDTQNRVVVATHERLLLLVAQILEVGVDDLAFLRTRRALGRPTLRAGAGLAL